MSKKTILVVGDWFVDEYWLMGHHRSPESSRPGQLHARALHEFDSSIRSLCGAGKVATILGNAVFSADHSTDPGERPFEVHGIGKWYVGDTDYLRNMLAPTLSIGKSPFCLAVGETSEGSPFELPELHNLLDAHWLSGAISQSTAQENANGTDLFNHKIGTSRVIRKYVREGSVVSHQSRIDWETKLTPDILGDLNKFVETHQKNTIGKLAEHLKSRDVCYILVKDHNRGVVTPELIRILHQHFPNAHWYVSSKNVSLATSSGNGWLKELSGEKTRDNVKLVLVPKMALSSNDAISGCWLHHNRLHSKNAIISQAGLEGITGIKKRFPFAHVVGIPSGARMVAHASIPQSSDEDRENDLIIQSKDSFFPEYSLSPMASVLFPTIAAHLICDGTEHVSGKSFFDAVQMSLDFTLQWVKCECKRFRDPRWQPPIGQILTINKQVGEYEPKDGEWTCHIFNSELKQWTAAHPEPDGKSERGVIQGVERREFHLWRGMTEVEDFVSISTERRDEIRKLLNAARTFVNSRNPRTEGYLLRDTPGGGKSYLVKCLADALNMRLLKFNITQLMSRHDLLHCFEVVGSHKARFPNEPTIVFFDEINAKLNGQKVYDAFLAPLEDGIYVKDGLSFPLGPCFWIFAGTETPAEAIEKGDEDLSAKGIDFISRLSDRNPISLQDVWPIEFVYVGIAVIKNIFPDVVDVSEKVIHLLYEIGQTKNRHKEQISFRTVRKMLERLERVRFAEVLFENIPPNWMEILELDKPLKKYKKLNKIVLAGEGPIVKIKTQPDAAAGGCDKSEVKNT